MNKINIVRVKYNISLEDVSFFNIVVSLTSWHLCKIIPEDALAIPGKQVVVYIGVKFVYVGTTPV